MISPSASISLIPLVFYTGEASLLVEFLQVLPRSLPPSLPLSSPPHPPLRLKFSPCPWSTPHPWTLPRSRERPGQGRRAGAPRREQRRWRRQRRATSDESPSRTACVFGFRKVIFRVILMRELGEKVRQTRKGMVGLQSGPRRVSKREGEEEGRGRRWCLSMISASSSSPRVFFLQTWTCSLMLFGAFDTANAPGGQPRP